MNRHNRSRTLPSYPYGWVFLSLTLLCVGLRFVSRGNAAENSPGQRETAVFAGGCFWCMEHAFDTVIGVVSVTPGYTGGRKENPTYEEVSDGGTGHAEAIRIIYDPQKIRYAELLDIFWHNIDPTVKDQQFCDRGHQYRSAIFTRTPEQKKMAEESRNSYLQSKKFKTIYIEIVQASRFYPAETYHQGYHTKNPLRYKFYRTACGRDQRLKEIWGDPR